jgi:hypothetical protein
VHYSPHVNELRLILFCESCIQIVSGLSVNSVRYPPHVNELRLILFCESHIQIVGGLSVI